MQRGLNNLKIKQLERYSQPPNNRTPGSAEQEIQLQKGQGEPGRTDYFVSVPSAKNSTSWALPPLATSASYTVEPSARTMVAASLIL